MTTPAFPTLPGVSFGVRTAILRTDRLESFSGRRTIAPRRTLPRWQWQIPFEFLRSQAWRTNAFTEFETLQAFWNLQSITGSPFAYLDPDDQTATAQLFGLGDGVTTSFQLVRSFGGFVEPVYLPTITSVSVNGVTTGAYTLGNYGVITFATAPGAGLALSWTGTFSWLCRFDDDSVEYSRSMAGLYEVKSVKFSCELNP